MASVPRSSAYSKALQAPSRTAYVSGLRAPSEDICVSSDNCRFRTSHSYCSKDKHGPGNKNGIRSGTVAVEEAITGGQTVSGRGSACKTGNVREKDSAEGGWMSNNVVSSALLALGVMPLVWLVVPI